MKRRGRYLGRLVGVSVLLAGAALATPAWGQWEFNTSGDTEGWSGQHSITGLAAGGGVLNGTISGDALDQS